jgi:hypothetical protein
MTIGMFLAAWFLLVSVLFLFCFVFCPFQNSFKIRFCYSREMTDDARNQEQFESSD